jgi:DNA-directed RNA polymerase specialized sigma24 family protein
MADLDVHHPAITAGDADAFGRWMAAAEPELRRGLRPFAAVVDCEAVLQESLLRVWQTAPGVQPDGRPNALLRFAVRVSRNLAISEARRLRVAHLDEASLARALDDAAGERAGEGPDPLLREAIARCRESLPEKPAAALTQRLGAGGGEPDEALAERLGMRLNTFLQNFTRARKLLAACLEARGITLALEWR